MLAGMQDATTYSSDYTNINNTDASMIAAGAVLVLGSWIWAQIDAPHSATKKNHANGYFSWNLNKSGKTYLALEPDVNFTQVSICQNVVRTPTYGLSLKLHF